MTDVSIIDLMDRGYEYDKSAETSIDENNKKRYSDLAGKTHEDIYNAIINQVEKANVSEEMKAEVKAMAEDSKKFVLDFDRAYTNVLLKEAEQKLAEVTATHEQVVDDVMSLAGDMVIAGAEATGNALPSDESLYSEADQSIEGSRSR